MRLTQALYFSTPLDRGDAALQDILALSRRNNPAVGVTGILVLDDAHYYQLLEGPRSVLSQVIGAIQMDTRHLNFTLVLFDDLDARRFSNWSMAGVRFLPGSGGLTGGCDPLTLSGKDLHALVCGMAATDQRLREVATAL